MNSGIYGMTSGQSLAGRKIKTLGGTAPATFSSFVFSTFPSLAHATPVTGASTPVGVRTRLLGIADKGALRAFAMDGGGTDSTRVEIIVDGVTIWDRTINTAASTAYILVGFGGGATSANVFVPDYIPFDNSAEFWVTRSSLATTNYAFTVDLHQ